MSKVRIYLYFILGFIKVLAFRDLNMSYKNDFKFKVWEKKLVKKSMHTLS